MDEPKRIRLKETWHRRDLPVLVEVADRVERGERGIRARHIATAMGWEFEAVAVAIEALSTKYIEARPLDAWGGRYDWGVTGLTEPGRRAAGLWPDGDGVDALLEALRQAEEGTDDAEERTLIHRAAGAIGSVSRDVMVDVLAAVIARQSGVG